MSRKKRRRSQKQQPEEPQPVQEQPSPEPEEALEVLQEAYMTGHLSHEEFEDRRQFCLKARYAGDLSDLVSDLPGGAKWKRDDPSNPPERIIVADEMFPQEATIVLRNKKLSMTPSTSTIKALAVFGTGEIHIEDVMAPGVVIQLTLSSVFGMYTIYVPWRVEIIDRSLNIMSVTDIEPEADGDGANGALMIKGVHVLGGVTIRVEEYLKEERRKSGRRWGHTAYYNYRRNYIRKKRRKDYLWGGRLDF